jgi:hypothetical protein
VNQASQIVDEVTLYEPRIHLPYLLKRTCPRKRTGSCTSVLIGDECRSSLRVEVLRSIRPREPPGQAGWSQAEVVNAVTCAALPEIAHNAVKESHASKTGHGHGYGLFCWSGIA